MPVPAQRVPVSRRSLFHACQFAGLDTLGAVHLRSQSNETWLLPGPRVVVRMSLRADIAADAPRMMALVQWLVRNDLPVAPPWPPCPGPIALPGARVATFWKALEVPERRDYAALGHLLRQLHAAPLPADPALPTLDPVALASRILAEDVDRWGMRRSYAKQRIAELADAVRDQAWPLAAGLLHGDAHIGNVLLDEGRPVLSDWDSMMVGNPGWDLVPTAVEPQRWRRSAAQYATFAAAYGHDVTTWDGYHHLRELAEWFLLAERIKVTAAVPRAGRNLRRQLATMRAGGEHLPWYDAPPG